MSEVVFFWKEFQNMLNEDLPVDLQMQFTNPVDFFDFLDGAGFNIYAFKYDMLKDLYHYYVEDVNEDDEVDFDDFLDWLNGEIAYRNIVIYKIYSNDSLTDCYYIPVFTDRYYDLINNLEHNLIESIKEVIS